MTDQEINVAIAKACGWERPKITFGLDLMPDYCRDINAMQSALKSQGQGFNDKFAINLEIRAAKYGKHFHQLSALDWAEEFISQSRRDGLIK